MGTLDLSEYVRVTNRTGSTIKARYDGKDYLFVDGEPTDIHNLAAAHIFGVGVDDKTPAFHRLGWLNGESYEHAMAKLDDIEFGDVPSPAVDIKATRKRAPKRIGSPTPLADAGAEEGAAGHSAAPTDAAAGEQGDL